MDTVRIVVILAMAALSLTACGRHDENSEGNGPGNADGFGGRADPPAQDQPAAEQQPQQPSGEQLPQQ